MFECPLSYIRCLGLVPNKNMSMKECYIPRGNGVSWDTPFRGGCCDGMIRGLSTSHC